MGSASAERMGLEEAPRKLDDTLRAFICRGQDRDLC
jgi:hypothetical protein